MSHNTLLHGLSRFVLLLIDCCSCYANMSVDSANLCSSPRVYYRCVDNPSDTAIVVS